MREAEIPYLENKSFYNFTQTINLLNQTPTLSIDTKNWGIGKILPKVSLQLGWNENALYLLYTVIEKESLRRFKTVNAPVWKDSCVEFFIQPNQSKPLYYNFEFNSLGTLLSQEGTSRKNRIFIKEEEASLIQTKSEYIKQKENNQWKLAIMLPKSILAKRDIFLKKDAEYSCNFYKCGDDMNDPHYLSWNPIEIENPDFHRVDFFGKIKLRA